MKVKVIEDERYPEYIVEKFIGPDDKGYYDAVLDIPDELYEEWETVSKRHELLQNVIGAYLSGDNLNIIEKTAELKGLIK